MSGQISCRALTALFRYLNERGISLVELLVDLKECHVLFCLESWVPESTFAELFDRAAALSGDNNLVGHVGEMAADPSPDGLIPLQVALLQGPEALLRQAGEFLGLLQRGGRVNVSICQPGRAVIECLPPEGGRRGHHLCTYTRHLLAAIPHLWQIPEVQIRELRCTIPLLELRPPSGKRYSVDPQGQVWEFTQESAGRQPLGHMQEDNTFCLDSTLHGADGCLYEITWSVPQAGRRRTPFRLSTHKHHRRRALDELRKQQRTIQALREQILHLKQTTEARTLERTDELRVKARQMAIIEQAGRRFASILDPEALLQAAGRTLGEDFGYFTVALYLLEKDTWTLRVLHTRDETVKQQPGQVVYGQPADNTLLQNSGRPLLQDDLLEQGHPLGLPPLGRGRSSMTVPLIASSRLLGVLDLQSPLSGHLNEDDALLMHTLAPQIAIALERSLLYRQEQRARQRADAMAMLSRVLSTTLEPDAVLSLTLDQIRRVLPYDSAAILLLEKECLQPAVSHGLSPQGEQALCHMFEPRPGRPLAQLLEHGEALLATQLGATNEVPPPTLAPFHSWLAIPLTSRGKAIGAVLLASRQRDIYGEQDLRLAQDLAGQSSTAIENARLYNRIRQEKDRLETLYEIARELNTDLEIDEVLRHILKLANASVGAVVGSIILLDSSGRPTHSILSRSGQDSLSRMSQVLTEGAAGWVIQERQPLLIQNTLTDPRWVQLQNDHWPTRSAIIAPLIGRTRILGVLTVTHPHVARFSPDDLALLVSVAGQASIVVQRAHLFAAIQEERARLETVIEDTADAIIILDESGRVLHVNRSAGQVFDLEVTSLIGRPLREVQIGPALRALLPQPEEVAGSGPRRTEVPFPDGRTFFATMSPIPEVGGVITMQDISHLKELDRMKSDFVATVSHDLRTPLGAVQNLAEMLELAGPLNKDQSHFTDHIILSVGNMISLVEDLLDLAKIEAGVEMAMAPCQLAAVIAEVVDHMAGPASIKPVFLQVDVPDDLPLVWGHGHRLEQVISNLLDNAIKYAPPNGQVTLRARPQGDELQVDVVDNGPGIPTADLSRIFIKFYRARHNAQATTGTGLGLSIAHSIVLAHRGRIWVESKEGEGTSFSFCIPLWTGKGV